MNKDRESVTLSDAGGGDNVRFEFSEPVALTYRYQCEPVAGLAVVQSDGKASPPPEPSNLLSTAAW
jgi:hypothetical protein